ncbi:MATE family efflux transporter [Intestinimonas massiliensis]|jgi:putative MATE family efflux protein|uniref:Probable multidrug resistance protein NorM n=1 Tax=Intestinimonas massiliensis (ex Afouda et al. 2020) TaxID=1673721 RepID=A0AAW5JTJ8_9FIRM|nr:MATE family efflux transporter [Intestinimonas massiliensis (ex Afouda et al. 2020)]MCG4528252.1 MATE family efflux transporter [Intestinimonas massiliensis (ex Afouda et al. 2020)]MCQ4771249.1 MATE family efflux transporter [Intestinimonas massiliensis (ex Afouda et al. 2020)]
MGVMPVRRLLITMSLPMVISMLVQALYNVVDSMFVSYISEYALTAVGLAFPAQNLMISVGVGTGVGVNALLSKSLGEKNFDAANKAAVNGIFLAFCSWAAFALLGGFFSRTFMALQTDVPEIIAYGDTYLTIIAVASVGMMFQICFERLLQSTGKTIYTMLSQGLGAVINLILDPLLIFGLGPFPAMGIAGAALATVIGQCVGALLGLFCNLRRNPEITISFRGFRPHGVTIRKIYAVGVPSIIMSSIGSVMTFGMNKILGAFNSTAVAVFSAYFKLESFIFMPVFGLNNGIVPIIAYNYGARKPDRIRAAAKLGFLYGAAIMAVGVLLFWLIPGRLLGIFNASDYMLEIGIPALRLISLSFLPAAFGIVTSSVCQALGHGVLSLIVSVLRQLVLILPVSWLLGHFVGLSAVWAAFPFAEVFSFLLSAVFMGYMFKTVVRPLEQPEP